MCIRDRLKAVPKSAYVKYFDDCKTAGLIVLHLTETTLKGAVKVSINESIIFKINKNYRNYL